MPKTCAVWPDAPLTAGYSATRPAHAPRRGIPGLAGTWPVRRPYDLRHAALSPWLASGAPPAEVAARAGHSVHVLLTTYAHCMPGCDRIASQHLEQALHSSRWPPGWPTKIHVDARNFVRHASVPQLDPTGHN